jgi:hypothetical protein
VFILDPFFDIAALGANEFAQPDIKTGQIDGYPAPAVKHRWTSFAADGGWIAFRAFLVVLHRGHLNMMVIAKRETNSKKNTELVIVVDFKNSLYIGFEHIKTNGLAMLPRSDLNLVAAASTPFL